MSEFMAFIIGVIAGAIFGVLIMALLIGAKKSGGVFLPEDD